MGNSIKRSVGKTNNKVAGNRPEGCITDPRKTRMQETSWCREEWRCLFEGRHLPRSSCSAICGWMEGISVRTNSPYCDSNDGV